MKRPSASREECLASLFLRHLWREVLHLRVLPRSRLTHSGLLRDPGDQALCSCTSLVYLKSCPRWSFPSAPFCRYRSSDRKGHPGDGRRAHAQTRKIFVMKAVVFRRSEPQLRGYQIQGVSVSRGRPCSSPTAALETLLLSWWLSSRQAASLPCRQARAGTWAPLPRACRLPTLRGETSHRPFGPLLHGV